VRRPPRSLAQLVRGLRARLPELGKCYGVRSLGIFGSYLRGEQKPRSDLDVLVEFDAGRSTLDNWIALQTDLQDALGVKIDLIENKNLKPFIGKRILSEVVWLRRDGKDLHARVRRRKQGASRMSAKREYLDFLSDMVMGMNQVERFVTGVTFDEFVQNEEKVLAATRVVESIGQAVKHIPREVRSRYPEIDWKNMAGMRDHLTHGYFAIDLPILWETATIKIPQVKPQVAAALAQELQHRAQQEAKKGNGKQKNSGAK
jgi:uncharacterized protein with HEPN domain/predicted nucleotidyltransferase